MVLLLFSYAFFGALLYLTGLGFLKAAARFTNMPPVRPTFAAFWAGYCVFLCLLEALTLFLPGRFVALPLLSLLALAGFLYARPELARRRMVLRRARRVRRIILGLLLFAALLTASQAVRDTRLYDTYLYHANAVRWATDFAAVPGLVNLHGRLGFNSSFHVFSALMNLGPLRDRAASAALSLLYWVALAQFALTALRLGRGYGLNRGMGRVRADSLFALFIAPFLFTEIFTHRLASLSSDHVVYLAGALLMLTVFSTRAFRGGFRRDAPARMFTPRDVGKTTLLFLLASAAVTAKLSAMPLLLIPAAFAAWLFFASFRPASRSLRDVRGLLLFSVACAICMALAHMARNVVLSGWLWYPVPMFNFHLDWSPPAKTVHFMANLIRDWARMPGPDFAKVAGNDFWFWFKPWLARFRADKSFVLLAAASPVLLLLTGATLSRARMRNAAGWTAMFLVNGAGLVYFFLTAPDVRFAQIWFWLLPALALTGVFLFLGDGRLSRWAPVPAILLLLWWSEGRFHSPAGRIVRPVKLPANQLRVHEYKAGPAGKILKIHVPVRGDQCGNSPLPCSPVPPRGLMEREAGTPAAGYRIGAGSTR